MSAARIVLVIAGFVLLVGCLIAENSEMHYSPVNVGWFLVCSSCFLAAALWRDGSKGAAAAKRYDIYQRLSQGPLSFDEFNKGLIEDSTYADELAQYHAEIASMLDEGSLVISDGNLSIAKK